MRCRLAFPARRRPVSSAIRRWPRRFRLGPLETPSSRLSSRGCQSSGPKVWNWRSCRSSGSRACWARSMPSRGGTSHQRSRRCSPRWRATSPSSCSRATCTSDGAPSSTTGARLTVGPSAQRRLSSSSRAGSRKTGAISHRHYAGTPFRTSLTPPTPLGPLVTQPERAHPFYRARLKMRAPVVPTHGWPKDTTEVREPNWAWRAIMARDHRPDSTLPPRIDRRWTPVDLPVDPLDPSEGAWHAKAARRMAFGRVFATAPNVGIVTFARVGDNSSVRHIIAGELFPIPDTGNSPTGLQPYIVHEFALAPVATSTWDTSRPKITDDGGWGVDTTEPV